MSRSDWPRARSSRSRSSRCDSPCRRWEPTPWCSGSAWGNCSARWRSAEPPSSSPAIRRAR
ncbi:hypothetical protein C3L29_033250, partial [Pseudomonas sp. MWU12-2534b]